MMEADWKFSKAPEAPGDEEEGKQGKGGGLSVCTPGEAEPGGPGFLLTAGGRLLSCDKVLGPSLASRPAGPGDRQSTEERMSHVW